MRKIYTLFLTFAAMSAVSAQAVNIYIANKTEWTSPTLYAWADGLTDPFGAWPGLEANGSETIKGVTFDKYEVPAAVNGKSVNIIYNINSSQLGDVYVALDKDLYFTAFPSGLVATDPDAGEVEPPVVETANLYVQNLTGWSTLNIYAWSTGNPELFGGWPGATAKGSEKIEGVDYLTYEMNKSDIAYNFILNNGDAQYNGPTVTPMADIFMVANESSATVIPDPRKTVYTLYIEDNTGWSTLNVYAYGDVAPKDLFGGWPGSETSGSATVDGVVYKTLKFEGNGNAYNLIFNNGTTQYDVEPQITADRDYYIHATATGATIDDMSGVDEIGADTAVTPRYFDLQGRPVADPQAAGRHGVFIRVVGSEASKVAI